jgi:LCP family protein required for cell wall assembly
VIAVPERERGPAPRDGATDILLVGLDSRTDAFGNPLPREVLADLSAGVSDGVLNTDTIILLRIPNDRSRPTVGFSVPRDSYVRLADGLGKHKINSAYTRGQHQAQEEFGKEKIDDRTLRERSRQAGEMALIRTVQDLTGVTIDHYAEVNLVGFAELTTVIGGVPVCLRESVRDRFSGADFPAGHSTVFGRSALSFVRQRHGLPNGDIDRVTRQQAFLASVANKILDAGMLTSPTRLDGLLQTVRRYVVVDQHWDLIDFAKQMSDSSAGGIEFRTIPVQSVGVATGDGSAITVDPDAVRDSVAEPLRPPGGARQPGDSSGTGQSIAPFKPNVFPGSSTGSTARTSTGSPDGADPSAPPAQIKADSVPCVN